MQEEVLKLKREFSQAIVKNDAEAVARFLADDWIIIDPDGGIIDKAQFLAVGRLSSLQGLFILLEPMDWKGRLGFLSGFFSALVRPLSAHLYIR
jgi:hypothetical protein